MASDPLVLTGGDLVLPDRVVSPGTVVIEGDRITEVREHAMIAPGRIDVSGHYVVPAFIDVHIHGLGGIDALDGSGSVAAIAAGLPKYGVGAFCPTSVACSPAALRLLLEEVRALRLAPPVASARVLPAHLESNFINPEFRGAQPEACLRLPPGRRTKDEERGTRDQLRKAFTADEILEEVARGRPDVAIVTLASELPGALDLVRTLVAAGHLVSLGHSGSTLAEAEAAIAAGATQATHLFNRMPPLGHRDPGLAGAVLSREEIAAEIICDGRHVHPAMVRMAIAAKHPSRIMAITDATAGAGLPSGSRVMLGGRPILVAEGAVYLEDGTMAGGTSTMDGVFRFLVTAVGLALPDAVTSCSTTPARELGLQGHGVIAPGAVADLAVLDREFRVARTFIGGRQAYSRN